MCTLFEGDYDIGVAALLNSLFHVGFKGTVCCGYRGREPRWGGQTALLKPRVHVEFIPLVTESHLTYYKPTFLKRCWVDHPDVSCAWYFDPDLVVLAPWRMFNYWAEGGVALCEDVNSMPRGHPMRAQWRARMAESGRHTFYPRSTYYNAGLIGTPIEARSLLDAWEDMIALAENGIADTSLPKSADRFDLFHSADQDALNMALMTCDVQVNATGKDGMSLAHGLALVAHAIGSPKPWQSGVLLSALKGFPPGLAHQPILNMLSAGPLRPIDSASTRLLRIRRGAAAAVGRVYHRR